jgi:trehalose 6-phosphate phosphatase
MEDKEATIALHYRGATEASVTKARAALREVLRPFGSDVRLIEGKKVWEMLPREVGGKGAVARREWRTFRRRALPVYIGDDAGDEPAFAALDHGITVRVGPASLSRARHRLCNPAEVRRFLEKIEAELRSIS